MIDFTIIYSTNPLFSHASGWGNTGMYGIVVVVVGYVHHTIFRKASNTRDLRCILYMEYRYVVTVRRTVRYICIKLFVMWMRTRVTCTTSHYTVHVSSLYNTRRCYVCITCIFSKTV
jgi:ABC-type iron transport system FetAB permease component